MFTGLVEEVGSVRWLRPSGSGLRLCAAFGGGDDPPAEGASVALNGVCLTVSAAGQGECEFDLSHETGRTTTFGSPSPPSAVNVERALRADSRIGGHMVLGHVDGIGTVTGLVRSSGSAEMTVALPPGLSSFCVAKGSVAIDGVSLTIARVSGDSIWLVIIPETLRRTTLGAAVAGGHVNVETDIIGKYVMKFAGQYAAGMRDGRISEDFLRDQGYM